MHGFRYFDDRDLIGFVDGTENPRGQEAIDVVTIGAEDAEFEGGTYVIVQKYLHDMAGWDALSTEQQERIIGRKKLSDIELDAAVKPTSLAQLADYDRRERRRGEDPARQHAFRATDARGVRDLFYRVQQVAEHD